MYGILDDVKQLCLDAHNYVRSLHPDLPGVTWSSDIAKSSEIWAAQLVGEGNGIR